MTFSHTSLLLVSETDHGIFEQVLRGQLDFVSEPWPSISENAKDLVRKMLVRDPKKRLTVREVLGEYAISRTNLTNALTTTTYLSFVLVPYAG